MFLGLTPHIDRSSYTGNLWETGPCKYGPGVMWSWVVPLRRVLQYGFGITLIIWLYISHGAL